MVKQIKLNLDKKALVDDIDYINLANRKWYVSTWGYAIRKENGQTVTMHIEIMGRQKGKEIDHRNGDKLDNRRANLRFVTATQNLQSRRKFNNNTSGYRGVTWLKAAKAWQVCVRANKIKYFIGYFKDKIEAARAYDKAAKKYHGNFAQLNFN